MATKIKWTDDTWNPVWGCKANCDYCYAKGISKRFASVMAEKNEIFDWNNGEMADFTSNSFFERNKKEIEQNLIEFKPTFLGYNYEYGIDDFKLLKRNGFPKKNTKRIFVGSMSDIAFWKYEWIELLIEKIKRYPLHTFQLLTKFPDIYKMLDNIMPDNVWFGITVTEQKDMSKLNVFSEMKFGRLRYVSFEPLLGDIVNSIYYPPKPAKYGKYQAKNTYFDFIDWVIIGTMSRRRIKRTTAKLEWIKNIIDEAKLYNIPVFVKQIEIKGKIEKDLTKFPEDLQFQEFPNRI
jgi:protein gp37